MKEIILMTISDKVALIIGIGFFFLPIFIIAMIVCGKFFIKKVRENKELKKKEHYDNPTSGKDYYNLFGGIDNIAKLTKELNRATIDVIDMSKVDFNQLKNLGIGVLVTGNQLKISSAEIVKVLKEK